MEIRDQLLKTLERQRDIQESVLHQTRNIINNQRKSQEQVHRAKLNVFAALKQTLLHDRSNTKLTGREQIQNLVVMKKNLTVQEREVKASGIALEQLAKQAQELVAQLAQVNEQRRTIRECSVSQCVRVIDNSEERISEEQSVFSLIRAEIDSDENTLVLPVQGTCSESLINQPSFEITEMRQGSSAAFEEGSMAQYQSSSEQRAPNQSEREQGQVLAIDSHDYSNHDQQHALDQEHDPQLSFNVLDSEGKQIAVALTLRPERGIEVNVQRNQAHALVQSEHEARRIERALHQAGLEVAQVTVSQVEIDKKSNVWRL